MSFSARCVPCGRRMPCRRPPHSPPALSSQWGEREPKTHVAAFLRPRRNRRCVAPTRAHHGRCLLLGPPAGRQAPSRGLAARRPLGSNPHPASRAGHGETGGASPTPGRTTALACCWGRRLTAWQGPSGGRQCFHASSAAGAQAPRSHPSPGARGLGPAPWPSAGGPNSRQGPWWAGPVGALRQFLRGRRAEEGWKFQASGRRAASPGSAPMRWRRPQQQAPAVVRPGGAAHRLFLRGRRQGARWVSGSLSPHWGERAGGEWGSRRQGIGRPQGKHHRRAGVAACKASRVHRPAPAARRAKNLRPPRCSAPRPPPAGRP